MKILITGGAGYIGNALNQQLSKDESIESIHIYDNLCKGKHVLLQQSGKSQKVHFTQADILDNKMLKKALKDIDIVIHLASVNHPVEHHYMEQVNHWGTANICNLVEESPIKRFIFLSTADIYDNTGSAITLSTNDNPQMPYAKSMLRAEKYVQTLSKKCEVAIVRAANVYGYNPAMHFANGINKHLFEAKYSNLLQLDADGLHTQSAIHLNDLTKILTKLTKTELQQPYFLAATERWNGMELYETFQKYFPELEATFTSHHLRLQDNTIQADAITQSFIETKTSLSEAIEEFTKKTNY